MSIEIVYTVEDTDGSKGTTAVKVGDGVTLAGLTGFAAAWATAVNNVIRGKILSAVAHILASISGLTNNTVTSISDVEHIGKFQFVTASGIRADVNIPALAEVVTNAILTDELDQSDTEVAAFLAAMEDGINAAGALIQPCDVGGDSFVGTVFAREGARNSGARR